MKLAVIQFPGSCDERDAVAAAARVGEAELVWHRERDLRGADAVIVPGGFSYGDYLRAGAIARFAPAIEAVGEFAREGGLVLGICNGFQVLCEAQLLPGALLPNANLRFTSRQVGLEVVSTASPFTSRFTAGQRISIPAKHSWGRYYADGATRQRLHERGQVLLRYAPGENFNGSLDDIAGVCNAGGNVFGLMPHPEHAVDELTGGSSDGLGIFASMAGATAGALAR